MSQICDNSPLRAKAKGTWFVNIAYEFLKFNYFQ